MLPTSKPFESDVISDGTQMVSKGETNTVLFESDVISDGTQIGSYQLVTPDGFESDVISDGTQIFFHVVERIFSLRVM